ncbi:uncharacterized protein [Cicer arietinum]|uniref:Uncharacterized protein LOC101508131 n=1 Tax=Cicer arietinum TaxID=3827 RepID=A0A1S2Y0L6_CICAR|nr:uncharacterized protein LOC101508131 [Cicer arietinum]
MSRVSLALCVFFAYFPGLMLCAVVSLNSIEIFQKHMWLKTTSTVYFLCKGENKAVFEDVKRPRVSYAFNGQQSWQLLSNFLSTKCKWCGLYEENSITSDDVLDEWEFCPSDFTAPDGEYTKFKENQFNATFLCRDCLSLVGVSSSSGERRKHIAVVVFLGALASIILILGVVPAYNFWLKKRKEEDQVRFLKLLEEGDENEDELGLGSDIII